MERLRLSGLFTNGRTFPALFAWLCLTCCALSVRADVDFADPKALATAAKRVDASKSVEGFEEVRGLPIFGVTGSYDRGVPDNRVAVATQYFQNYQDNVDFLIVFTAFSFEKGEAVAFATAVKNDVQGLGLPLFDHSDAFGSSGKLQTYIDMAALQDWDFNPLSPAFAELQDTAAHELMHRFGVYAKYRLDGGDVTDLLGRDQAHWSFFLDTDASVMYGADWQEQTGVFRAIDIRHRFSPLDLYLAGFRSAAEVPPMTLIRGGVGASATDLPRLGFSTPGTPETVTIEQIIAASGPRVPDAQAAPKHFRAGLILLVRPELGYPTTAPVELHRFARELEQRFSALTEGRGTLSIRNLPHVQNGSGAPTPLVGSAPCATCSVNVPAAKSWILAQQRTDGALVDHPALARRSSAAAVKAMRALGFGEAAIASATQYLTQNARHIDDWSGLVGANTLPADTAGWVSLRDQWQNKLAAGGGGLVGGGRSPLDIAQALVAEQEGYLVLSAATLSGLLDQLTLMQNSDGSFGVSQGGVGHVFTTARVLSALAPRTESGAADMRQRAAGWLLAQRQTNGAFGDGNASLATAAAIDALASGSDAQSLDLSTSIAYFGSQQGLAGDWAGSVLTTAEVLQASELIGRSDLSFDATGIQLNPVSPVQGDTLAASVRIRNVGQTASPVRVRWLDGLPDQGGQPIGPVIDVGSLPAGQTRLVELAWPNVRPSGERTLSAVLDPDQELAELSETNNTTSRIFTIQPLPALPDAGLVRADFELTPTQLTTYPTTVTLRGQVHNFGGVDFAQVPVRLVQRIGDALVERASLQVSALSEQSVPIELTFVLASGDPLQFTLQVDPENSLPEYRESNNELVFSLATNQQLDLDINANDLELVTTPAVQGQDAAVRVRVRNLGLLDSPNFDLVPSLNIDGQVVPLASLRMQIPAQQMRERTLTLPLPALGTATLSAALDPSQETSDFDRDNNQASLSFAVVAASEPNLLVLPGGMTIEPDPPVQGQPAIIRVRVQNLGAASSSAMPVRLETGGATGPRTLIGTEVLAQGLAAGANAELSFNIPVLSERGERYFFATIDPTNSITESNEQDNTAFLSRLVQALPDAAVSVASVQLNPSAPAVGQAVTAQVTVRNLGEQPIAALDWSLYEGTPETGALIPGSTALAAIPAGGSATQSLTWTFGLQSGATQLTLLVDPSNTLAEIREDNNRAIINLNASTDPSVDEPFFSPNGDGTKDTVTARFRQLGASAAAISVVNAADRTVRRFSRSEWGLGEGVSVVWDGRTDQGTLAPDGDYRVRVENDSAQVLAAVAVTLDTNQASILEAVDSSLSRVLPLPDSIGRSLPGRYAEVRDQIIVGAPLNLDTVNPDDRLAGIYRFDLLTGALTPVLDASWLAAQGNNPVIVNFELVGAGEAVLLTLAPNGNYNQLEIWRARTDARNAAVRLQSNISGDVRFDSMSATEAVISISDGSSLRMLRTNLQSGAQVELNATGVSGVPLRGLSDGVLMGQEPSQLWFVSANPAVAPQAILDGNSHATFLALSDTGVLIQDRTSTDESLRWVNFRNGVPLPLASEANAERGCVIMVEAMPDRDIAFAVNARRREVSLIDATNGSTRTIRLPAMQRLGSYAPTARIAGDEEVLDLALDRVEPTRFAGCQLDEPAGFAPAKRGADHLRDLTYLGASLDYVSQGPDSPRLLLTLGEQIVANSLNGSSLNRNGFHAAVDTFALDIVTGAYERLGGATAWPLQEASDQARYQDLYPDNSERQSATLGDLLAAVASQQGMDLSQPRLILPDHSLALPAGTVGTRFVLPDGRTLSSSDPLWFDITRFPSESGLLLASTSGHSYVSLANLAASLRVQSSAAGLVLSGVAADRNFQSFELDWASAAAPNFWRSIGGVSETPALGGEMMVWVPPAPGSYRIRLTVRDRAGNQRAVYANAYSVRAASLTDLRFEHLLFSPNGDGVKDTLSLRAEVLQPLSLVLRVQSATGATVRTETISISNTGPFSWTWDGRNQQGAVVPDGNYRLTAVDQFSRSITVDTTPPVLSLQRVAPDLAAVGKQDRETVAKPYFARRSMVQFGLDAVGVDTIDTQWTLRANDAVLSQSFSDTFNYRNQYAAGQSQVYQLHAVDAAGNEAEQHLSDPGDDVRLLAALASPGTISALDALPLASIEAAAQAGVELVHAYEFDQASGSVKLQTFKPPFSAHQAIQLTPGGELALDVWVKGVAPVQSIEATYKSTVDDVPHALTVKRWQQRGNSLRIVLAPPAPGVGEDFPGDVMVSADVILADGARLLVERALFQFVQLTFRGFVASPDSADWLQFGLPRDAFFEADEEHVLVWFEDQFGTPGRSQSIRVTGAAGNVLAVAGHRFLATLGDGCVSFEASATDDTGRIARVGPINCGQEFVVSAKPDYQQCGASGPERLILNAQMKRLLPGERVSSFRVSTRDALNRTVEQFVLTEPGTPFECTGNACAMPSQTIDLTTFPDGNLELEFRASIGGSATRVEQRKLKIDRRPISFDTLALGSPAKVCMQAGESDLNWILDVRSDLRVNAYGPFQAAAQLTPVPPETALNLPMPLPGATEGGGIGFSGWKHSDPLGAAHQVRLNRDWTIAQPRRLGDGDQTQFLPPMSGAARLQLAAASSVGLLTCSTIDVEVDTNVRATLLAVMPEQRVINPDGAEGYREAILSFRVEEAVTLQADVRPLPDGTNGEPGWENLVSGQGLAPGVRRFVWNGRLPESGIAPDGRYEVRLRLVDDCGLNTDLKTIIRIDTLPPSVNFDAPDSGSLIATPTVPIEVQIADDTYQMGIRQQYAVFAVAETELPLAAGNIDAISQYSLSQVWHRGSRSGNAGIRVRATDAAGNFTVAEQNFQLAPRSNPFFDDVRIEPTLISPNQDGRSDQTLALYQLGRAAELTVNLLDQNQQQVSALLNAEPQTQGAHTFSWQGAGLPSGAADGVYWLELIAQAAGNANDQERVLLPIQIDRTAPTVQVSPAGSAFAPLNSQIRALVADPHFASGTWRLGNNTGTLLSGDNLLIAASELAEGEHTLTLQVEDAVGNRAEHTTSFSVDRLRPEAAIALPTDRAIVGGIATEVAVMGTAKDRYFTGYQLDLAAASTTPTWTTFKQSNLAVTDAELGTLSLNKPDGDYLLRLSVRDRAEQTSEVVQSLAIDRTAPVAAISAPSDGAWIAPRLRVSGQVTDAHLQEYRLQIATPDQAAANLWTDLHVGDTAITNGELAAIDLGLADGDYRLRVLASDAVGLTQSQQVRVRLDSGAPPAPIQLIGSVQGADAELSWQPVSVSDLAGYRLYRNGEQLGGGLISATQFTDAGVGEGTHRYQVSAVDQAGNESARSNTVTLVVDRTPPDVSLSAPADNAHVSGVQAVTGRAYSEDDFAFYEVWINPEGSPTARTTLTRSPVAVAYGELAQIDTNTLQHGQRYIVHLRTEDQLGNGAEAERVFTVDTEAPDAPLTLTATADQRDANVSWSASSAADVLGYVLFRDGTPVNAAAGLPNDLRALALTGTSYRDANLADGQHVWWVHAIDQAGNLSAPSNQASLTFSGNPPLAQWLLPTAGAVFETDVVLEAISPDSDVVEMRYEYRAEGASDWNSVGAALVSAPYRTTWTPSALPYGTYELRAIAKDDTGLETAEPPIRIVSYRDLTPPDVVTDLVATGDGDHVHLQWSAVTASDLAGYRIQRQSPDDGEYWSDVDTASATTYDDMQNDGAYRYRVAAIDTFDNLGAWSNTDTAVLFSLEAAIPLSPVRNTSVNLQGSTPRAGDLQVRRTHANVTQPVANQTLAAAQAFAIDGVPLLDGEQIFALQLTDQDGNRSRQIDLTIVRGDAPSIPTNVQVSAADHDVTVSWAQNPESNLLGYRVFHRGEPVLPDAPQAPQQVSDDVGWNPWSAFDSDAQSAWLDGRYFDAGPISASLDLEFTEPMLVSALELDWKPGQVPARYQIEAETSSGFVPIADLTWQQASQRIELADAYRTARLRVRLLQAANSGNSIALAEMRVWTRPFLTPTMYSEQVIDGRHSYQVSALNTLGFESARSAPVSIDIGDVEPPLPVVLSGNVQGSDVSLQWTASASVDLDHYELWRDGARIAVLPSTTNTYVDTARPNGTYTYWVNAVDAFDNQSVDSNHLSLDISVTSPAAPTLTVSAVANGGALQLSWQAGSGSVPASYRINRGGAESGPYTQIATSTQTSLIDAPLQNGVTYWYTVIAVDAAGNVSPASVPQAGTPSDQNAPATPVLTYPVIAGETRDFRTQQVIIAGQAEPSDQVAIRLAGQIHPAMAKASTRVLTLQNASLNSSQWLSLDGARIFEGNQFYDLESATISGQTIQPESSQIAGIQDVSAVMRDGRILSRRSTDQAWVIVNPTAPSAQQVITLPLADVQALLVRDDLKYAIARADQSGQAKLFVLDLVQARAMVLNGVDAYEDLRNVRFAARAPEALLGRSNGSLIRIDLQSGAFVTVANPVSAQRYAFVETDQGIEAVLFADTSQGGSARLIRLAGSQRTDLGAGDVFAVSPLGDQIAVAGDQGQLRFLDARTGAERARLQVTPEALQFIAWTPSMRLFAADGFGNSVVVDPAGSFRSAPIPLNAGLVPIQLRATDGADQSSSESAPGYLNVQLGGVQPDLAVSATQIVFNPAGGAANQAYGAQVQVRNLGQAGSPVSALRVDLIKPDGSSTRLTGLSPVPALGAGGNASIAVNLGVLTQSGAHYLDVLVDADNQISEKSESNNAALARLLIAESAEPQLELILNGTQLAANGQLAGSTRVTNLGANFSGAVTRQLETAAGAPVADLGQHVIQNLGFAAVDQLALSWPATGSLAQDYAVVAILRDEAGIERARQRTVFTVATQRQLALAVSTDGSLYDAAQVVRIRAPYTFEAGNALIDNANLLLRVFDAQGSERARYERALGTLLPGTSGTATANWTSALPAGLHQVRAEWRTGATVLASAQSSFQVQAPAAPLQFSGQILPSVQPFQAGVPMTVGFAMQSNSSNPTAIAALRLVVRNGLLTQTIAQTQVAGTVAAGNDLTGSLDLSANPLPIGAYLAQLDAQVQGESTFRALATLSLQVRDMLPPTIRFQSPVASGWVSAPADLAARVTDAHSGVDLVEMAIDGNPYVPVGQDGSGNFVRAETALTEGSHQVRVRARDRAGNLAESDVLPFAVDITPPVITITGVTDGQQSRTPLTPVVLITDDHLATQSIVLNSTAFTSGTTVSADGYYVLSVTASDLAGNQAYRTLQFQIDLTPPSLAFEAPLDGAEIDAAQTDVVIRTEPNALVDLTVGAYSAQQRADDTSTALFTAVPLVLGANTLSAIARDELDNISAPTTIQVTRIDTTQAPLVGSLAPSLAQFPLGQTVTLNWQITNPATQARNALPIELEAHHAGNGTVLGTQAFSRDVPAGATLIDLVNFASAGKPLGAYVASLRAQVDGSWVQLASASFELVDQDPPTLTVLVPTTGQRFNAPFQVSATATDILGTVDAVDVSISAGPWLPMSLIDAQNHRYESAAVDLPDGQYGLRVRALDQVGNLADSGLIPFGVDRTPPQILISGVSDGAAYATPVAPLVQVSDLNLDSHTISLNGQPFVSGTTVSADGDYTLIVSARDLAGNQSEQTVRFRLDQTAPVIGFTFPAEQAVLAVNQVDVGGLTEPAAAVEFRLGANTATVTADAQGGFVIPAVTLNEGSNLLEARARDALGNTSAWTQRTVRYVPNAGGNVLGTLAVVPISVPLGQPAQVSWTLTNQGTVALSNLPLTIRFVRVADQSLLDRLDESVSLGINASTSGSHAFDTASTMPGAHIVLLEAVLVDGNGQSSTQILATQTIDVRDVLAPSVSLIVPQTGAVVSGQISVEAEADDLHSTVQQVQASAPGIGPVTLSPIGNGRYVGDLKVSQEGSLSLMATAEDSAGNRADSAANTVLVDLLAPVVQINGVSHDTWYNTPVSPEVVITDVSLRVQQIRLNGADYVSGTPVSADGTYLLTVHAEDALGRSTDAQRTFHVDQTPPAVQIIQPADQSIVFSDTVAMLGTTEPFATLQVQVGTSSTTAIANSQGVFQIAALSLQPGNNVIVVRATDRAGNVGAPAQVQVERRGIPVVEVQGDIQLTPTTWPNGDLLSVPVQIRNTGTADLPTLPITLRVTAAGNVVLATEQFTLNLPAGSNDQRNLTLPTNAWGLGNVTLRLSATLPQRGQDSALDTHNLTLVDQEAPTLTVQAPTNNQRIPVGFQLQATAIDRLNTIAAVRWWWDSEPARLMTLQDADAGRYVATLPDLAFGPHMLHWQAEDAAGNLSTMQNVAVQVVGTLPLSISSPTNGSDVADARITVVGQTAAMADVRIRAPGLDRTVRANAAGQFEIADIAIIAGNNHFELQATDAFGNQSALLSFTVRGIGPAAPAPVPFTPSIWWLLTGLLLLLGVRALPTSGRSA